jgi:hypothetical protein
MLGVISDRPDAAPLHEQVRYLCDVLTSNPVAVRVMAAAAEMDLPDWYLGAGAVSQTVWNHRHGFEPASGIKDYDVVYLDGGASVEMERDIERELLRRLARLDIELDVKNEAHVHLWYAERFGKSIAPYVSTEDAISTWPTTASCVGIRSAGDRQFVVCAPYGLADVLGMVARPNKQIVTQDVYEEKTRRWADRWPGLTVIPW